MNLYGLVCVPGRIDKKTMESFSTWQSHHLVSEFVCIDVYICHVAMAGDEMDFSGFSGHDLCL